MIVVILYFVGYILKVYAPLRNHQQRPTDNFVGHLCYFLEKKMIIDLFRPGIEMTGKDPDAAF